MRVGIWGSEASGEVRALVKGGVWGREASVGSGGLLLCRRRSEEGRGTAHGEEWGNS